MESLNFANVFTVDFKHTKHINCVFIYSFEELIEGCGSLYHYFHLIFFLQFCIQSF